MKKHYRVIVSSGNGDTVLDITAESKSAVRAIQNVLRRHQEELEQYTNLSVNVEPYKEKTNKKI